MALAFAAEYLAPHAVDWDQEKHFPVDVMRKAAALGMGGIYIREDVGGSGLTRLDAALIFEALATGCPTISAFISIHNMATWMIDTFGTDEQRHAWLPRLCSMELIASYCLTEPGAGSDAAALSTRAVRDGDDYVLNGGKQFISGAGASDVYVVMVRTGGDGRRRHLGVRRRRRHARRLSFGANEKKMGWNAQPTRAGDLRGRARAGREPARRGGRSASRSRWPGSTAAGSTSRPARSAARRPRSTRRVAYLEERKAFGKPSRRIPGAAVPARRHGDRTRGRAHLPVARGGGARRKATPTRPMLCAMAKRFATDVGFEVANEALQLHGGYGYLAEYGIEKIVRDLRVHQILEGTNEIMRVIVARELIGGRAMSAVRRRAI